MEFKHPIPGQQATTVTDAHRLSWKPGPDTVDVRFQNKVFVVKRILSFRELSQFINNVMDMCFPKEHEIAVPEAADFAIRLNVIMMYADIVMPDDLETQYRMVYESGLYEAICEKINAAQLESIKQTVQTCVLHMM